MEFHEKLQELRKSKNMTQEELAAELYVSRTAISKWESGRGYPGIDSLKQISSYFSVSIDDLLSGDVLLSIAEEEHGRRLKKLRWTIWGLVDLCAFGMIVLPLYPEEVGGYVYAVNLPEYTRSVTEIVMLYWVMLCTLGATGAAEVILARRTDNNRRRIITNISMSISIAAVIYLIISRVVYAAALAFVMLIIKVYCSNRQII